jgi:hypothetical protein
MLISRWLWKIIIFHIELDVDDPQYRRGSAYNKEAREILDFPSRLCPS